MARGEGAVMKAYRKFSDAWRTGGVPTPTLAALATLAAVPAQSGKLHDLGELSSTDYSQQRETEKSALAPAKVAKIAKVQPSLVAIEKRSWGEAEEERAALTEYDGRVPRAWAEGLARLDPAQPPADVPSKRWVQFIDDCGRFLDNGWATKAETLGWGPLDLFGCDRDRPFARMDHMGLRERSPSAPGPATSASARRSWRL
jgi:hypothetical protein